MSENKINALGEIIETLPNTTFRVELESGVVILAYLSGQMRQNFIKVVSGDWVEIEMSVYDLTKGRIVKRLSNKDTRLLSQKKHSSDFDNNVKSDITNPTIATNN